MRNVAGCSRNCINSLRVWKGLFDSQGRNALIEILTYFRRATISAQLPRHRLRVADSSSDKKFSTEEGADKALITVKCTNEFSTRIALHWIFPKKVRAHILEERGAHKSLTSGLKRRVRARLAQTPGAGLGDETPHSPEASGKG